MDYLLNRTIARLQVARELKLCNFSERCKRGRGREKRRQRREEKRERKKERRARRGEYHTTLEKFAESLTY